MAPIMAKDGSVLQNGDLEEFLEKNLKEAKVIDKIKTSARFPDWPNQCQERNVNLPFNIIRDIKGECLDSKAGKIIYHAIA